MFLNSSGTPKKNNNNFKFKFQKKDKIKIKIKTLKELNDKSMNKLSKIDSEYEILPPYLAVQLHSTSSNMTHIHHPNPHLESGKFDV